MSTYQILGLISLVFQAALIVSLIMGHLSDEKRNKELNRQMDELQKIIDRLKNKQ